MADNTLTMPANAEMIEGFIDGYNLSNPEPSDNRSHSYRHGFRSGRADQGFPRKNSIEEILTMAADAMRKDENV